jgi:hypothetical protein
MPSSTPPPHCVAQQLLLLQLPTHTHMVSGLTGEAEWGCGHHEGGHSCAVLVAQAGQQRHGARRNAAGRLPLLGCACGLASLLLLQQAHKLLLGEQGQLLRLLANRRGQLLLWWCVRGPGGGSSFISCESRALLGGCVGPSAHDKLQVLAHPASHTCRGASSPARAPRSSCCTACSCRQNGRMHSCFSLPCVVWDVQLR